MKQELEKLGFIYDGKMIATGTPEHLKESLPGKMLEIRAENPMKLLDQLRESQMGFNDAYVCGASLRILVDDGQEGKFHKFGAQVISPSLEDVFVHYTKLNPKELAV